MCQVQPFYMQRRSSLNLDGKDVVITLEKRITLGKAVVDSIELVNRLLLIIK
jgi:hypothetical protein